MSPRTTIGALGLALTCAAGGVLLGILMELTTPLLGAATAIVAALLIRYRALALELRSAHAVTGAGRQ